MRALLISFLLFVSTVAWAQSYSDIVGKQNFKDSVRLSKYKNNGPDSASSFLTMDSTGRFKLKKIAGIGASTDNLDSVLRRSGLLNGDRVIDLNTHLLTFNGTQIKMPDLDHGSKADSAVYIRSDGKLTIRKPPLAVLSIIPGTNISVDNTDPENPIVRSDDPQVSANTAAILQRVKYIDTAVMLLPYLRKLKYMQDSTAFSNNIAAAFNSLTKLNDSTFIFNRPNGSKDTIRINSSAGGGSGSGWSLDGNSADASKFLGTTSNNSLRIRTGDIERARFDSLGNLDLISASNNLNFQTSTGNSAAHYINFSAFPGSAGNNSGSDIGYPARILVRSAGASGHVVGFEFLVNSSGGDATVATLADLVMRIADDQVTLYKNFTNGLITLNGTGYDNKGLYFPSDDNPGAADANLTISAGNNSFSDRGGGELKLQAGANAGSGTTGKITFWTSPGSGAGMNTKTEAARIESSGSLLIGTTTENSSSKLTISSTTKGVLLPRMTTTEKLAISSPDEGLEVYDLTLHQKSYWNGTLWINL